MPDKKNKVDKKTWIIRILQILERYSDKDHGLSVARIVELLEEDMRSEPIAKQYGEHWKNLKSLIIKGSNATRL